MLRSSGQVKFHVFFLCALASWPGSLLHTERSSQENKRLVTVRDCIQMTRLADSAYRSGASAKGRVVQFSPSGEHFVVVLRKGNLDQNTDDYSLLLYKTGQALDSPQPRVLLTLASSSNRPAISEVKWLDNDSIAFLGENPGGLPQIHTLNTSSGNLQRLTDHRTPILSYDVTADQKVLVFVAEPLRQKSAHEQETVRFGMVIGNQFLEEILAGDSWPFVATIREGEQLFVKYKGESARQISMQDVLLPQLPPPSLSPDGRYAIVTVFFRDPPRQWEGYQDTLLAERVTAKRVAGAASGVPGYILLDTTSGNVSHLLNAPLGLFPRHSEGYAWAPDGHSVVLSGTFLPLDVTDPRELDKRRKTKYVIELRLPNREITTVTERELKIVRWDRATNMISLESRYSSESAVYGKTGSGWKEFAIKPEDIPSDVPLEVNLEEDINTPPRISVSISKSNRRGMLLDLNPQFEELRFGKVEAISWKATDGHEVLGGLYLPPDYAAGKKYPLVIQTHGFAPSRFMIDGPWGGGAFSAQPLASRGFVVLQVGASRDRDQDRKYINTTQEAPRETAGYEGAIEYLVSRGIVDPSRVGIIGFSRTMYTVEYALTHSKYRFAAATVADGFDAGYFSYIGFPNKDYENLNGGPPFGETLQLWLKNAPGFNLEKVRTPVRIEVYSVFGIVGAWEWFSGLRYLGKPVELIYLRDGTHLLVKPSHRLASQEGNVDWFSFWLKGEEDPDPGKAEQYARWRELRKQQGENSKKLADVPRNN